MKLSNVPLDLNGAHVPRDAVNNAVARLHGPGEYVAILPGPYAQIHEFECEPTDRVTRFTLQGHPRQSLNAPDSIHKGHPQ